MHSSYWPLEIFPKANLLTIIEQRGGDQQTATPLNPTLRHSNTPLLRFHSDHFEVCAGGGGGIRTRGPRCGRRFSRPVVSTTHPPLRDDNFGRTTWRRCFRACELSKLRIAIRRRRYKET